MEVYFKPVGYTGWEGVFCVDYVLPQEATAPASLTIEAYIVDHILWAYDLSLTAKQGVPLITLIKLLRNIKGYGLKEAKDAVEQILRVKRDYKR